MQVPPPPQSQFPTTAQPAKPAIATTAPFLQGLVLCFLALVCAGLQFSELVNIDPFLAIGLGCLLAFFINPRRLFIPTAIFLPVGIVNILANIGVLNGNLSVAYYFIALALGLMAIAYVVKRRLGWAQPGALSPGLFIFLFGVSLLAAAENSTLAGLLHSIWAPIGFLGGLGVLYLMLSAFGRGRA
jgi:hypothetical protein